MSRLGERPRSLDVRGGAALVILLTAIGCGGGGGGNDGADGGNGDVDAPPGGGDVTLADQVGCHMLGDIDPPAAVAASDPDFRLVCIDHSNICLIRNESVGGTCLSEPSIFFEWEPGTFYNVKAFGWMVETSSHGEVTTQTNADSGILGVPVGTVVTTTMTRMSDGMLWDVVFRMEDDYVVFLEVAPPGGW